MRWLVTVLLFLALVPSLARAEDDRAKLHAHIQLGIERLLAKTSNPEKRADLLFRLAEAHLEEAKGKPPDVRDKWTKSAVELCRNIIVQYPRYSRGDEVLVVLAIALEGLGQKKDAVIAAAHLIKSHPASRHLAGAWLRVGEFYFDAGEMNKAAAAFQKAADTEKKESRLYATYKLAWCYYNLQALSRSAESFESVVRAASRKSAIYTQALKDLVRVHAEVSTPEATKAAIEKLTDAATEGRMLDLLAETHDSLGKFQESIETHRMLIDKRNCNPENLRHQTAIVRLSSMIGNKEVVVQEQSLLSKNLTTLRKCRLKVRAKKKLAEYEVAAEELLRGIAQSWWADAR